MSISFHTDGVAFDQKNCDGKIAEFRPTPKMDGIVRFCHIMFRGPFSSVHLGSRPVMLTFLIISLLTRECVLNTACI